MIDIIQKHINEHKSVLESLDIDFLRNIEKISDVVTKALISKNTVFWCGNGGSCSDSLHLSAELIGRFEKNRIPLKSISLSSDVASITCIANDFGYNEIFSRQLDGLGSKGDILFVISTSGESENAIYAAKKASDKGIICIGLLGKNGGKLLSHCDYHVVVPSFSTARIQEAHILFGHIFCDLIELKMNLKRKE